MSFNWHCLANQNIHPHKFEQPNRTLNHETTKDEEYNWKEDLTTIHIEDMISSKNLSRATYQHLLESQMNNHQKQMHRVHSKVLNNQTFSSFKPT